MSLTAAAVRRPVSTVAALLAVLLMGSVSLARLPVSLLPDVSRPVLTVRSAYPGAAAEDASRSVAEPIEEAIAATPGLTELRSVSRNGEVVTTAHFTWGTDMRVTVLAVRERLDAVRGRLPERAGRPTLLTSDPGDRPIAILAVRSLARRNEEENALRALAQTVRAVHVRRIEQLDGVSRVAVVGAPDEEVRVTLDADRLRAFDLTAADVAAHIRLQNVSGAGGTIRSGQFRVPVRALTEFRTPTDILDVPIGSPTRGLYVRDVGVVHAGLADPHTITRLDGAPAVGLMVYKDAGANSVAVTQHLTETITQLQREFPALSVTLVSSHASFVVDAIANLGQEIVVGSVLSLLVILLFLRDWRMSLAIGLTVPVSVLMAMVVLQALDVTVNVLSLGGLALGTGLLVDTAIVVVESVSRRRSDGMSLREAAVAGTSEVAPPLVAGTLTTVLVFGPIVFVRGLAAALFRDLSLSVVTTVTASLLVSLTLMPVLLAGERSRRANPRAVGAEPVPTRRLHVRMVDTTRLGTAMARVGARLGQWYECGVGWSLAHPWSVCGAALATVMATGMLVRVLPKEILPRVDDGLLVADLRLAQGTALEATVTQVARLEAAAQQAGARHVYARVGQGTDDDVLAGANAGSSASAQLLVPVPAGTTPVAFAQRLRAAVPDLAAGALVIDLAGQGAFDAFVGRDGHLVRVELTAPTLRLAQEWADSVRRRMAQVPALVDVREAYAATQPVVELGLERARMARHGILPQQVADALAGALGGVAVNDLRSTDHRTPITVRYTDARTRDLESALRTTVRGIPVGQLVTRRDIRAPVEVVRVGQRPVTIVEAFAESGGTARARTAVYAALSSMMLPPAVAWQVAGADSERQRTSQELMLVAVLATALMFLVLAGEFASMTTPLVVMLTVPLAGAGSVLCLWVTGQSLNVVSLIGIVVMIGMADNEAVVKLEAIRRLQAQGVPLHEAILCGGSQRLRAIAMTSITTVTGVLPLLFGWGSGGALYRPLAASIVGGSITTLLVTCFLLPVAYAALEGRSAAHPCT